MEFVDIAYSAADSTDPFRQFDIVLPSTTVPKVPLPLLVFIHGGAWRSEDKRDYRDLAHRLATATAYPVAVLNYRLTPTHPPDNDSFRHPHHSEDVLNALRFLAIWPGPSGVGSLYDPHNLYLMGHSCSAHMLSSIFLNSSSVTPTLTPEAGIFQAVKGIIMSEGIYDIDLLLQSFPTYLDWFIRPALGHLDSYIAFSAATFPLIDTHIKWLIIHSKGDTLVDLQQSDSMYQHLCNRNGSDAATRVFRSVDILEGEHNDILHSSQYVDIIRNFLFNI